MISASAPCSSSASCSSLMLPSDLAIFSDAHLHHAVVHPDARQRPPPGRLGLRDLVLVVGEHQVRAAAVDLEVGAQQVLGHGRALDVPPRPPLPPGRGPSRVLVLLVRLPQREVAGALLEVGGIVAFALLHLLPGPVRKLAVLVEAGHAEIHVAARRVGVPGFDEDRDQVDDPLNGLHSLGLVIGASEAETVRVPLVVGGHLGGQVCAGRSRRACGVVDLVVHVGHVLDQGHLVPLVLQEALEQGEHHERPRIADVHASVDGGPAGIDRHPPGLTRLERLDRAAERVVKSYLAHVPEAKPAVDGGPPRGARTRSGRRVRRAWPRDRAGRPVARTAAGRHRSCPRGRRRQAARSGSR